MSETSSRSRSSCNSPLKAFSFRGWARGGDHLDTRERAPLLLPLTARSLEVAASSDEEGLVQWVYWRTPIGTDENDGLMRETPQREADDVTEAVVESLSEGPCHLEYHYYGALV